jgi:hypothetical protein
VNLASWACTLSGTNTLLTVLNSTFDALAHEVLSLGLSVAFAGWTALGAALHGRVFKRDALEASGGYEYAASREREPYKRL